MSKHQIIDQIRRQNRSADVEFLATFNEEALNTYLKRLALSRGRSSGWVREGKAPAAMTRLH